MGEKETVKMKRGATVQCRYLDGNYSMASRLKRLCILDPSVDPMQCNCR